MKAVAVHKRTGVGVATFIEYNGGWNSEGYASVELIESHKSRAEFEKDYKLYIEVLRDLAKQAGIPTTVDSSALAGIKTHDHCRRNQPNNRTDHVDPYPYLAKWGISQAQFAKDVANGSSGGSTSSTTSSSTNKKVEILAHATRYSKSSNGAKIADWVKKQKTFEYDLSRPISQSRSNTEYRIVNNGTPIGWVLSQDIKGGHGSDTSSTSSTTTTSTTSGKWIAQSGTFTPNRQLPLTVNATGSGSLIANIPSGSAIKYDAYMIDGNYVWIRQPRGNSYGYMATGNAKNGKRVDYWGTFK